MYEECLPKHMDSLIIWEESQNKKKITFNSLIYDSATHLVAETVYYCH